MNTATETMPTYTLLANLQAAGDAELCDTAFDTLELDVGITRDEAVAQAKSFTEAVIRDIDHDRYAGETVTVTTFLYTLEPGEEVDDGGEEIDETDVEIPAVDEDEDEDEDLSLAAVRDAWQRGYDSYASPTGDKRSDVEDKATFCGSCAAENGLEDLALDTITQSVVDEINAGRNADISSHASDNADEIEAGEVEEMTGMTWAFDIGRAYACVEAKAA